MSFMVMVFCPLGSHAAYSKKGRGQRNGEVEKKLGGCRTLLRRLFLVILSSKTVRKAAGGANLQRLACRFRRLTAASYN